MSRANGWAGERAVEQCVCEDTSCVSAHVRFIACERHSEMLLMPLKYRHAEAIPHLYRSHTFSLLHITHLLCLPTRIPSQRLNSIRRLRLRWAIRALPYLRRGPSHRLAYREDTANWERAWGIIAGMQGLRDLFVVLVDPSAQGTVSYTHLTLPTIYSV